MMGAISKRCLKLCSGSHTSRFSSGTGPSVTARKNKITVMKLSIPDTNVTRAKRHEIKGGIQNKRTFVERYRLLFAEAARDSEFKLIT